MQVHADVVQFFEQLCGPQRRLLCTLVHGNADSLELTLAEGSTKVGMALE